MRHQTGGKGVLEMLEIHVASLAGFCFGVRHAVDSVENALKTSGNKRVFTLGKLIHNPSYLASLEKKGVIKFSGDSIT